MVDNIKVDEDGHKGYKDNDLIGPAYTSVLGRPTQRRAVRLWLTLCHEILLGRFRKRYEDLRSTERGQEDLIRNEKSQCRHFTRRWKMTFVVIYTKSFGGKSMLQQ